MKVVIQQMVIALRQDYNQSAARHLLTGLLRCYFSNQTQDQAVTELLLRVLKEEKIAQDSGLI